MKTGLGGGLVYAYDVFPFHDVSAPRPHGLAVTLQSDIDVRIDRARRHDAEIERLAFVGVRWRPHAHDAHVSNGLLLEHDHVDGDIGSDGGRRSSERVATRLDSVCREDDPRSRVGGKLGEPSTDCSL